MKAQPLIISLVALVTALVPATSHALDAKARDDRLGHSVPLTVIKGGLVIDGTGAPAGAPVPSMTKPPFITVSGTE